MNAHDILEAAAGHMKDRATTYDKPEGERSMGATVVAFNAITGAELTEEQGWLFMGLLKMVRTQQGAYRADNYEDGAAYFALQGEAAYAGRANACSNADGKTVAGAAALLKDLINWNGQCSLTEILDKHDFGNSAAIARLDIDTGSELTDTIAKHGLGHEAVSEAVSRVNAFHKDWVKCEGLGIPKGITTSAKVEVLFRDDTFHTEHALVFPGWVHDGSENDIIAYRILGE